jgi:pimeloyl-ACP methyl ester carboxylesterase
MIAAAAMASDTAQHAPPVQSIFVSAPDGLRLHVREYGARPDARLPVVCLPGLTRNEKDFATLATALAGDADRPRRVLALDYRGRGQSEYDRNADHYSLPVELADLLAVITARAAWPAVFVGTSRGGLLIMLLAAARPGAIAGAVLNDIGPVIEPKGLLRIKSYVGKLPQPRSFEEGAELLRRLFSAHFPAYEARDWLAESKRVFVTRENRLVVNYDPKLARTLKAIDPERPAPALWPQFDALAHVPLMTVRGALSDILSAETLSAMRARRPDMEIVEIADQGHAPQLADADTIARIADFVARCDGREPRHST